MLAFLFAKLRIYAYITIPIIFGVVSAVIYFISVGKSLQKKDDLAATAKQIKKEQKIEANIDSMSDSAVRERMRSKWQRKP